MWKYSYAVYGWNDNYVLLINDKGQIMIYDSLSHQFIVGPYKEVNYLTSIPLALEYIEKYERWDGGGDVNVDGIYYDFGKHDYSFKRNLKKELGYSQKPLPVRSAKSKKKDVPIFKRELKL